MVKNNKQGEKIREAILVEITNYIILHGYAPTSREIANAIGIKSTATVSHHMDTLYREGKIETDAKLGAARAYRVKGMRVIFENKYAEKGFDL